MIGQRADKPDDEGQCENRRNFKDNYSLARAGHTRRRTDGMVAQQEGWPPGERIGTARPSLWRPKAYVPAPETGSTKSESVREA